MMIMHAVTFLGMIALASGVAVYMSAARHPGAGSGMGKLFGVLIVLFSLFGIVCNTWTGYKMMSSGKDCPMCMDSDDAKMTDKNAATTTTTTTKKKAR